MKVLESKHRIRFPDCDPFNHLNNSRYLDYFINAREDQVAEFYEFPLHEFSAKTALGWVVTAHQIAYLRPAMLMENVCIQSCIRKMGETDLKVEMIMWNEDKTQVKALLWTWFTHVSLRTGKREQHSQELVDKFMQYELPLPEETNFEMRMKELKEQQATSKA